MNKCSQSTKYLYIFTSQVVHFLHPFRSRFKCDEATFQTAQVSDLTFSANRWKIVLCVRDGNVRSKEGGGSMPQRNTANHIKKGHGECNTIHSVILIRPEGE